MYCETNTLCLLAKRYSIFDSFTFSFGQEVPQCFRCLRGCHSLGKLASYRFLHMPANKQRGISFLIKLEENSSTPLTQL